MKNSLKVILLSAVVIFTITTCLNAQDKAKAKGIPSVKLKTLDGKIISTDDFKNDGKPIIIACSPMRPSSWPTNPLSGTR